MTSPTKPPSPDFTNRPSFRLLRFSDFTKHAQTPIHFSPYPRHRHASHSFNALLLNAKHFSTSLRALTHPYHTMLSVPPQALHTRFRALNPHHLKATSAITLSLFTIQTSFPPQQQPFPYPCFLHTASPIPRFIKFESSICPSLQTRFPNLSLSLF